MSFEDTIRVAQLKTRAARFERVREEIRAAPGQLFGITEFMKPRVAEIAGTLPARLGRLGAALAARARRPASASPAGEQVRTGTVSGFLLLYALAGLRRWRRGTLRFQEEDARIEAWLARIRAPGRARLRPGGGAGAGAAAHQGLRRNARARLAQLLPAGRSSSNGSRRAPTAPQLLSRLQTAALADEEGAALARELAALRGHAAGAASR